MSWKTTTFKAIESFPDDLSRGEKDSLWSKYFSLFDSETLAGTSHAGSLEMYKQNRVEMDAGASVFNPSAFCEADGHVSTLQKLLEIRHSIGVAAF